MQTLHLRVQAVIYQNGIDAVRRSCESIVNAVRYALLHGVEFSTVTIAYGDASEEPAFSEDDIEGLRALCEDMADIDYTFFDRNTGFGGGHNLLAKGHTSGWLLIMNPDIVVGPSFFIHMMHAGQRPHAGIVEARQTPIEHPKDYDKTTGETSWASGACMLIDAALFEQLDGFDDETFYMYCEDVDLSWRVRQAGRAVIYQPMAPAFHPKRLSPSARWNPTEWEARHSALSNLLMAYKWSGTERLENLMRIYAESDQDIHKEALAAFEQMKEHNKLPVPIDTDQHIPTFIDGEYAKHRFTM